MKKLFLVLTILFLVPSLCFGAASRDFDGVDDKINCGSNSVLDNLGPMTILAWIDTDSGGEVLLGNIVTKDNADTAGRWLFFLASSATAYRFFKDFDGASDLSVITNSFGGTGKRAVSMTWDGSLTATNVHIYVNGVEATYSTQANGAGSAVSDASIALYIGNRDNVDLTFDGRISYVQIWNRVLNINEITQATTFPGSVSNGLVGFWPLTGDSPETDLSGNGNTGTVTGAATSTDGAPVVFAGGLPL